MPSELSQLCQQCGFCCDGTLFTHVRATADERARLSTAVTFAERADGAVGLCQPCRALEQQRCRVYEHRPQTCADYVCLLGRALVGGETTLAHALTIVESTRQKLDELAADAPASETHSVAQAARAKAARGELSASGAAKQQALEQQLRLHFVGFRPR